MKKTVVNSCVAIAVGFTMTLIGSDVRLPQNTGNIIRNPNFKKLNSKNMAVDWFRYNNLGLKATDDCYILKPTIYAKEVMCFTRELYKQGFVFPFVV